MIRRLPVQTTGCSLKVQCFGDGMKLEPIKLDSLRPVFGQGSKGEVFNMSFNLSWKGFNILVFMHHLDVYILVPHDFKLREEVVKSEREIKECIKEEFGREINSLTLVQTYLH